MAREGRQRLGNALLVADVGHDLPEDGQPRAVGGRNAQAGLVHERQEAERLQRHGLPAGIRAGDDEGAVAEAVTEAQVDRHRRVAEQRVARREELGGVLDDVRAHAVHRGGEPRPGHPQVGAGQCRKAVAQRIDPAFDVP